MGEMNNDFGLNVDDHDAMHSTGGKGMRNAVAGLFDKKKGTKKGGKGMRNAVAGLFDKKKSKKGGKVTIPAIASLFDKKKDLKKGGRGTLLNLVGKVRKSVKKRMIKRPKSIRNMYKQFSVIPRYRKTKGLNLLDKYIPKVMKR